MLAEIGIARRAAVARHCEPATPARQSMATSARPHDGSPHRLRRFAMTGLAIPPNVTPA
jgi:hypothetical protein